MTLDKYRDDEEPLDMSTVDVPQDCVGFVTGRGGNFLRQLEEEWNVRPRGSRRCLAMQSVDVCSAGLRRLGRACGVLRCCR